jgi:hypothetical protein
LGVLLKNAQRDKPRSRIEQVVECINRRVFENVREIINPRLVMVERVMMLDWAVEARTRNLRTHMDCADFRQSGYVPEMIEAAIDGITGEILEMQAGTSLSYCPYALVTGHEQIVDPTTSGEYVYFRTCYGLYELP